MKISQVHIFYSPSNDAVVLFRQSPNPNENTSRDATAEFVHALISWGFASWEEETTPGGKLWDRFCWWIARHILRRKQPLTRTTKREIRARGDRYNIIIEHFHGDAEMPAPTNPEDSE